MLSEQFEGITGHLGTARPSAARARKAERKGCQIGAGLRQRGASGVSVQVMDLSTHGFRAATHLELEKGADIWLKLPGLEALHGRVAWTDGYLVGCEFVRPLHPAVLQMVVTR